MSANIAGDVTDGRTLTIPVVVSASFIQSVPHSTQLETHKMFETNFFPAASFNVLVTSSDQSSRLTFLRHINF